MKKLMVKIILVLLISVISFTLIYLGTHYPVFVRVSWVMCIAILFVVAILMVLNDTIDAIADIGNIHKDHKNAQVVNKFITGTHLYTYATDKPDGTLMGFDADYGKMYAYKHRLVPESELPTTVIKSRVKY